MIVLDGENYLDGDDASTLLDDKLSTLYAYVSSGRLRSYKQGIKRQRLYKQAELEALLQLRPSDAPVSAPNPRGFAAPQEGPEIPPAEDWVPNV